MTMTIRPVRPIVLIGMQETNTIGYVYQLSAAPYSITSPQDLASVCQRRTHHQKCGRAKMCWRGLCQRPPSRGPCPPPPRIVSTWGRRRQVDTSTHFCPNPDCTYSDLIGSGKRRAHGHPSGGPWRQQLCVVCHRSFLEPLGTRFHGKRVSVELIVCVVACLAEGLGIRGTARVFEVNPKTVPNGWSKRRSSSRPFPDTSCTTCVSSTSNSMSCLPCSARSRPAQSARLKPSSPRSVRRSGSG
jgi:transposase-like protein